jgi:hypothetical protein
MLCFNMSIIQRSYVNRISLLPALSLDGIIYFIVKEGSHNAASFATFVDGLLYHMNPFPHPKSILVVDNAGIHKAPEIKAMVEARYVP